MSAILWWPEIYRAFDLSVPVSVGAGVSGSASGPADFGLEVPVGVGMSAEAISSGEFDLAVPISLGMRGPASTDLSVPVSIGMAGTEQYAAATDLSVPISLGATGALSGGPFSLEVPVGVGMSGYHLYQDDFNRPDSTTSPGPNWTNRYRAFGIRDNQAYPNITGNGAHIATYNSVLSADDMEVSITLGENGPTGPGSVLIILGGGEDGKHVLSFITAAGVTTIYTSTSWGDISVERGRGSLPAQSPGHKITLRRVGNIYTVLHNGNPTDVSWVDSSNVHPRDASHRIGGMGSNSNAANWTSYRRIDFWSMQEIT